MEQTHVKKITTFLPNMAERFKPLLDDLATVTQQQVNKARGMLREFVGGKTQLHATSNGAEWYLMAELSGDYAGLAGLIVGPKINLVAVSRKTYYFGPKIRVPLRAAQTDSKRANAKK